MPAIDKIIPFHFICVYLHLPIVILNIIICFYLFFIYIKICILSKKNEMVLFCQWLAYNLLSLLCVMIL